MLIGTAQAAADLLAPLFASAREERIVALHLDAGRRLLALTLEEPGGAGDVELPVLLILQRALRIGSHAIILAHNHPSGDPEPSEADRMATAALADAARAVGLRLDDHIVFGGSEWVSFRGLGLM
ncbi:MAG TPA: JAB domain-containing protein [Allosphingosinicella sp.]|jgi:DNA repair protein RadC